MCPIRFGWNWSVAVGDAGTWETGNDGSRRLCWQLQLASVRLSSRCQRGRHVSEGDGVKRATVRGGCRLFGDLTISSVFDSDASYFTCADKTLGNHWGI